MEKLKYYSERVVKIGEKSVSSNEFGGKGSNLSVLAVNNILVPEGVLVNKSFFDEYLITGKVPIELVDVATRKIEELGQIAIRSSATCEDGQNTSMAGVFETVYVYDRSEVSSAITRIFKQAISEEVISYLIQNNIDPSTYSMGLVIQELITPEVAGVAYTNKDQYLVQYVSGFGNTLVDGEKDGSQIIIDSKKGLITSSNKFEDYPLDDSTVEKLTSITNAIKSIFRSENQDIEFAIRNNQVFIVQSRPLTRNLEFFELSETPSETLEREKNKLLFFVDEEKRTLGVESPAFSNSNFIELLPNPTEIDYGVFSYIFTGLNGQPGAIQLGRQQMGYPLGNESIGFMHYIAGKPYMSIARDAATFYAGFPDSSREYFSTLVNNYLKQISQDPQKGIYPEMGLYLQDPSSVELQNLYGKSKGLEYHQTYLEFKKRMSRHGENFAQEYYEQHEQKLFSFILEKNSIDHSKQSLEQNLTNLFDILEHLRNDSCVYFVKAARLGFYYSQKLQVNLKNSLNLDNQVAEEVYGNLNQGLDGSAITNANLDIFNAKSHSEAMIIAQKVVGHYSTGEMLQIRHPRLKNAPANLEDYVKGIRNNINYLTDFNKQKGLRIKTTSQILSSCPEQYQQELAKDIDMVQKYMSLRETVKYAFAYEYSIIRDILIEIAKKIEVEPETMFYLLPSEITEFTGNPQKYHHIINSRQQTNRNFQEISLPSVIREKDIAGLSLEKEKIENFTELKGKFLSDGPTITGVIVNLDALTAEDAQMIIQEIKKTNQKIILVAKQMNLSHDPLIAISDSIILENAGIVSHGAQRARELGRSALGGIPTNALKTGMIVEVNPKERKITRVL